MLDVCTGPARVGFVIYALFPSLISPLPSIVILSTPDVSKRIVSSSTDSSTCILVSESASIKPFTIDVLNQLVVSESGVVSVFVPVRFL